jgi:hypothetical protein
VVVVAVVVVVLHHRQTMQGISHQAITKMQEMLVKVVVMARVEMQEQIQEQVVEVNLDIIHQEMVDLVDQVLFKLDIPSKNLTQKIKKLSY